MGWWPLGGMERRGRSGGARRRERGRPVQAGMGRETKEAVGGGGATWQARRMRPSALAFRDWARDEANGARVAGRECVERFVASVDSSSSLFAVCDKRRLPLASSDVFVPLPV